MEKKDKIIYLKDNYKPNSYGTKGDYNSRKIANTRHLTRILFYLQEVDYSYYNNIREKISIPPSTILDALKFLTNHNLIKKIPKKGISIYCLPYKENLVKDVINLENKRMNCLRDNKNVK